MSSDSGWADSAQQFQQVFGDSWSRALESFQGIGASADTKKPQVKFSPEKLKTLQQQYMEEARELWMQGMQGAPKVEGDRRFSGESWSTNPVSAFSAATYLLNARTLMGLADAVEADAKTRARITFGVEQWVAAMAPSNFLAFNAEAQKKAIETKGESIAKECKTCSKTSSKAMCR